MRNLYIGATRNAVASAYLTHNIFGAISPINNTIAETINMAIHAHFSADNQNSVAIPIATTVPREDIEMVTMVVQMRFTIRRDSFFSFIFLRALAHSLHFFR
jgi:hypothetical protein